MIHSMTGFGLATVQTDEYELEVEIRSLNSKQLDLNLKLPSAFRSKEIDVRNRIAETLFRGKVSISIQLKSTAAKTSKRINKDIVKAYYAQLKEIQSELEIAEGDFLKTVLMLPDVMEQQEEEPREKDLELFEQTLNSAIKNMIAFRENEGKALEHDLSAAVSEILTQLNEVEQIAPKRIDVVKERIRQAFQKNNLNGQVDENRFEQELIFYLEKLDVNEETVRLKAHCDYFLTTMKSKEIAVGKKLGFISQEMGREINTLGSKANDAVMQKCVILMKEELEKIKEQSLNIV
jgi:uncharacterized protein (TIGR00255 family)